MRLGLLGGTFDPIHDGHLGAAEAARDAFSLDRVLLVPASLPPHRATTPHASGYHRFAMVALAVAGRARLEASDIELISDGLSFTSMTLARFVSQGWTPSQLFFITGADAFAEISTWHAYPAILDQSHFVVVSRPGTTRDLVRRKLPDVAARLVDVPRSSWGAVRPAGPTPSVFMLEAHTADVSSTEIRRRLDARKPLGGLVPPAVAAHIERHHLYEQDSPTADALHEQE